MFQTIFNVKKLALATALAAGTVMPSVASAKHHDIDDGQFLIDLHFGPQRDHERDFRPAPPPEVYESQSVWVEPVYQTQTQSVWRDAVTQDVCDRVWVDALYEDRAVEVRDGHHRWIEHQQVLASPGHYEDRHRQVIVSEGHWETVRNQELVSPGHWEQRTVRVAD